MTRAEQARARWQRRQLTMALVIVLPAALAVGFGIGWLITYWR